MFSDRRNSVSNNSSVGKTLKSTARRTWIAVRNTMIDAVIDATSRMSSTKLGTGISITNTMLIAANGSTSALRFALVHPPVNPIAAYRHHARTSDGACGSRQRVPPRASSAALRSRAAFSTCCR